MTAFDLVAIISLQDLMTVPIPCEKIHGFISYSLGRANFVGHSLGPAVWSLGNKEYPNVIKSHISTTQVSRPRTFYQHLNSYIGWIMHFPKSFAVFCNVM